MKKYILPFFIFLSVYTQLFTQDAAINNLIHTPGYQTSAYGEIPEYTKTGTGKQHMLLIPGWGYNSSVFDDFMEHFKEDFTMYAITIPGYGKKGAPAMPDTSISYIEQSWNKSVLKGIHALIQSEKLNKVIIAGHFTQGSQLALKFAIQHPELIKGVIILGGQSKVLMPNSSGNNDISVDTLAMLADFFYSKKWFKSISKKAFDEGNYPPYLYSLDTDLANKLWAQSAKIPVPVMVRYLCEFFASDLKAELFKIKSPVLVLRPLFNKQIREDLKNIYSVPQFIDSWDKAKTLNPLIKVVDILNAATFVWKDNPDQVYPEVTLFMNSLK